MADRPHVLIVGAGIIGASIAWHLARASARVTVVEAGEPGGVATPNSWAWINASWGNPEVYFRLRVRAMDEWRRLERDVPDVHVAWAGGLIWDLPSDELEAYAVEHASWGYDIRRVDRAEVLRIEPQLAAPPDFALHAAGEGSVDPVAAARALLAAAQDLGATVIAHCPARSLDLSAGRVAGVETDTGRLDADEVVVAAGVGTAALAATAGFHLPMTAPPGLLVVTRPHERLLNGLVMAPEMHVRQTAEGRLVAGADFGGSDPGDDAAAAAVEAVDTLKGMLKSGASLVLDHHTLGHRPVPEDGFPAVGRVDGIAGLYVAVMHSGITLAPAIGRLVADEIMTGQRGALLEPYGPDRFSPAVAWTGDV